MIGHCNQKHILWYFFFQILDTEKKSAIKQNVFSALVFLLVGISHLNKDKIVTHNETLPWLRKLYIWDTLSIFVTYYSLSS